MEPLVQSARRSEQHATERGLAPSGFFCLRSAAFPIDILVGRPVRTRTGQHDVRTSLQDHFTLPVAREALFLASPDVAERLDNWLATPPVSDKLSRTIYKYFQRMTARATPFGLFAGVSVGEISPETYLEVPELTECRRKCRIDYEYLYALTHHLAQRPAVRNGVTWRLNTSLGRLGSKVRFVQTRVHNGFRRHVLSSVESDEGLRMILSAMGRRALTTSEMLEHLVSSDPEIDSEEAQAYIDELIGAQIVTSVFEPLVTGASALDDLLSQAESLPGLEDVAIALRELAQGLDSIERSPIAVDRSSRYRELSNQIATLGITPEPNRFIQVDLVRPSASLRLGEGVVNAVRDAILMLHSVAGGHAAIPLDSYREAFTARYEEREVPLVEVVDDEIGIGGPSSGTFDQSHDDEPLVHGLAGAREASRALTAPELHPWLLTRVMETVASGSRTLKLSEHDVRTLNRANGRELPESLHASITLADTPDTDGCDILLRVVTGPPGGALLGRFAHADPILRTKLDEHLRHEEATRPGAVFAEIVHVPMARLGNVVARPVLRQFEIEYIGRSAAPESQRLSIDDLVLSVRAGRFVLRSRSLDRVVVPRLTNAHNYMTGHPLYRLLCYLQFDRVWQGGPGWRWGSLDGAEFLPRVVFGRTVVSRARWRLNGAKLKRLQKRPVEEQWSLAQEWRQNLNLPRLLTYGEGDNELLLDFEDSLSVETFVREVAERQACDLFELFPSPDTLAAKNQEGRYVHEIVIPFVSTTERGAAEVARNCDNVVRSFRPGSEWLYLKIYCGVVALDGVLADLLGRLPENVTAHVEGWFFLRYADPEHHLRLRFKCGNGQAMSVMSAVTDSVKTLPAETAWRVQLDTYTREVERYGGGRGIELSEQLFCHDSCFALSVLEALRSTQDRDARWLTCMRSWDELLDNFGFTLESKAQFARERSDAFEKVLEDRNSREVFGRKYRTLRDTIRQVLQAAPGLERWQNEVAGLCARRSENILGLTRDVRQLSTSGALTAAYASIVASHLHMNANRLLKTAHAQQERTMYELLSRHYLSELARRKQVIPVG